VALIRAAVFLLFALLPALSPAASFTVRDDAGRSIALPQPAQRIVSLSPHITDILLALGARAQLVGVVDDHEVPGAWQHSLTGLPVVADAGSVNEERLLAQRPDLVLVWQSGMSAQRAQHLAALGLTVAYVEPPTLAGIADDITLIGQLSGHADRAAALAGALRQELAGLHEHYGSGRRLRAFYQVWLQPLYTVHGSHLISQGLALCGADNIMPPGKVAAPLVNAEFVVAANPDVIFFGAGQEAASRAFWGRFASLRAVRAGQLLALDSNALARPGPELIHALGPLCQRLAAWRQ
jgi:iron complex transport system substrate-binding protein